MFGSNMIEIAIGVISLFLLLSLIASAASELIEGLLKKRAKDLEKGIIELVGSKDAGTFVSDLYNHGLINSLYRGDYGSTPKKDLPSYIPSRNFALAVIQLFKNPPSNIALPNNIKTALGTLETTAKGDAEKLQKSVEDWYNSAMDRVSGWYKRRTQFITFALGLILAAGSNADCIKYTQRLSKDAAFRESAVAFAEASAKKDPNSDQTAPVDNIKSEIDSLKDLGFPIGWDKAAYPLTCAGVWSAIYDHGMGWLLTALAVSLGAPFWFDLLNKIMVIRSTVKPHEKSREEPSKDPKPNNQIQTAGSDAKNPTGS